MRTINFATSRASRRCFALFLTNSAKRWLRSLLGEAGSSAPFRDLHIALPDVGVVRSRAQPARRECRASAPRCAGTRSIPPARTSRRSRRPASAAPRVRRPTSPERCVPTSDGALLATLPWSWRHCRKSWFPVDRESHASDMSSAKAGAAESGIVHQHVNASMVADDRFDRAGQAIRIR